VIWGCVKTYSVNLFTQPQITHYIIRFHTNSDHSLQNTFSYKHRSISVCVKTYSVMSHLSLCENVFCNESSEFVWFHTNSDHSLQNTCSHKLRPLITEYVFTQTQMTHYRIRFHTNWDHSLQNTFSHKLRSLITEYVFIQTQVICVCMKTYSVMSGLSLCENVFCNEWSQFV
jgi:hypothetical protein